jgi:hypothetical protein
VGSFLVPDTCPANRSLDGGRNRVPFVKVGGGVLEFVTDRACFATVTGELSLAQDVDDRITPRDVHPPGLVIIDDPRWEVDASHRFDHLHLLND